MGAAEQQKKQAWGLLKVPWDIRQPEQLTR
jgi:hypothetical protein